MKEQNYDIDSMQKITNLDKNTIEKILKSIESH